MPDNELDICPLCDRPLTDSTRSEHHLIPKSQKGKETVTIHRLCHDAIHSRFRNKELAKRFNTIEAIKTDPAIQKFIAWIAGKDPEFYARTKINKREKGS